MKITVIYGQQNKGNTYQLTRLFLNNFEDWEITEFFLPVEGLEPCKGCYRCFLKGEEYCPHSPSVQKIVDSLDKTDLIVLSSSTYCMSVTGQMKIFFDHLGYRFMAHRPEGKMFQKQGLVISTAAGYGQAKAIKLMKEQLVFWGVGKIESYGIAIGAPSFDKIKLKRKKKIKKDVSRISHKIKKRVGSVPVGIKQRFLFALMKANQKRNTYNPLDYQYWEKRGWLDYMRPYSLRK